MEYSTLMVLITVALACLITPTSTEDSLLSILAPETKVRQSRSYYDYRYGRPIYDRDYERPRCGRCDDRYDEDDDDDDYDRRDKDDDRRSKPKHNSKKNYEDDKYDDHKNNQKNSTDDDDDKRHSDRSSSRRNRDRHRNRNRYDDRDRYRPDYYDRFLRDPYREREYDRPYSDDYYRDRRPYDRYPYPERFGGYGGGYEGHASRYDVSRRPYEDYGGYGPGDGRNTHGRPWDETYRGQSGWDAGGRGYYFASGRPEPAPAQPWGRPEYARPQSPGWQGYSSTGYNGYSGYNQQPLEYRVSVGYGQDSGYKQGSNSAYGQGHGQYGGWQSVGERRPYRDSSAVTKLDKDQSANKNFDQTKSQIYENSDQKPLLNYDQKSYGQIYAQGSYGQPNTYGQNYGQSSTTETSYLFARNDDVISSKITVEDSKAKDVLKEQ